MTKILIMEDNVAILEAFRIILETAGYEVCIARNGIEGSMILEKEVIDLILSNGDMPEMTGYEAVKLFKSNPLTAHIPFIIATAADPVEQNQIDALKLTDAHFIKPVIPKNLLAMVKQLLK